MTRKGQRLVSSWLGLKLTIDSSHTEKYIVFMPIVLHLATTWSIPDGSQGTLVPEMVSHTPRTGSQWPKLARRMSRKMSAIAIIIIGHLKYNDMQDRSTLSIDDSSLSVLHSSPKPALQVKNEQLFKQCSEYRTHIRQLRQDNEWLHSVTQGLTNECNVLKDMLNEKKHTIVEINSELRIANEEINRLEDLLADRDNLARQAEEKTNQRVTKLEEELNQARKSVVWLEKEVEVRSREVERVSRERESIRSEQESKEKVYVQDVQQKVLRMLERVEKTQKHSSEPAPSASSPVLQQLVSKVEWMVSSLHRQREEHATELRQKQRQLQVQTRNTHTLECQLREASELVEQCQEEGVARNSKLQQLEFKLANMAKVNSKNVETLNHTHNANVDRLVQVFSPVLRDDEHLLERLAALLKGNGSQYEIQVVAQEIKVILSELATGRAEGSQMKRQVKEGESRLAVLEEQYDSLKLKHLALQREFEAILDDNRRILKFNQLSRYRQERNTRHDDKENTGYNFGNGRQEGK